MPCTARAARACLESQPRRSARDTSTIWLSEQFVQDTFTRFCRGQRRYGSHIPGPLEARRRSSKRRATSLSYIPGNAAAVNPAILFAPQPQTGWWSDKKQDTGGASAEADIPLASWFAGVFGLPPPAPLPVEPFFQHGAAAEVVEEALETRLADAIRSAQSCDELRLAIQEGGINLSQQRGLSKIVLRRVMEDDWPNHELHNFFLEPYFHPPGTSNHLEFLQLQTGLDPTQPPSVIDAAFPKAIELGIVSVSDMQAIILSYPGHATQANSNHEIKDFWLNCIAAINQSSVVNVNDLGTAGFMATWLSKIHAYEMDKTSAQLIWQLRQYHTITDHDLFTHIISKWLSSRKADHVPALAQISRMMDSLPSSTVLFMITERVLVDALKDTSSAQSFDPAFRKSLKTAIREQLGTDTAESSGNKLPRPPLPLESWSAVLSTLRTRNWLPNALADSSLTSQLTAMQQETQGLTIRERLVSFAWTVLSTSNSTNASMNLSLHGLPEALISHFGFSKEGTPQDAIKNILETLDTLPLPRKQGQARMYMSLLKVNRKRMVNVAAVLKAQESSFASLIDNKLYQNSIKTYPHALTELAESVNQDMALFEKYATGQLQQSRSTMTVLQRILRHNVRLHLCLSAGWDDRDRHHIPRQTSWSDDKAAATNPEDKALLGGYTNSQIVDMINRFALEIARSRLLTQSQALAQVQKYYHLLLRYGAPIRPQMVQALWHAGIKRTGGRISGSMQEWIRDLDYQVSQQYQQPDKNAQSAEAHGPEAETSVNTDRVPRKVRRRLYAAQFLAQSSKEEATRSVKVRKIARDLSAPEPLMRTVKLEGPNERDAAMEKHELMKHRLAERKDRPLVRKHFVKDMDTDKDKVVVSRYIVKDARRYIWRYKC